MNKLPEDLKTKWVAALRSGDYNQGTGNLYAHNNTYCCLGVLGVVCGVDKEKMLGKSFFGTSQTTYVQDDNYPKMLYWDGRKSFAGRLSDMNDGSLEGEGRFSFLQIADYIEKEL